MRNKRLVLVGLFLLLGLISGFVYFYSQRSVAPQINLYPGTDWEDVTNEFQIDDDSINHAMAVLKNYDYVSVPFAKGRFWKTKKPIEYLVVESYYLNELKKEGWIVDASELKFDEFTLQGIVADGTCEGVMGYVGYKNGMVRLISIEHKLISCGPLGSPDATPEPRNTKTFAQYTVFISDPTPREEIADYIKNHLTK